LKEELKRDKRDKRDLKEEIKREKRVIRDQGVERPKRKFETRKPLEQFQKPRHTAP